MNIGSRMTSELEGLSIIGGSAGSHTDATFGAFDPRTGQRISPDFHTATDQEVELAVRLASEAASGYGQTGNAMKANFLNAIATNLETIRAEIVSRASLETGLPEVRFEGELGRTCGQLRMFAEVAAEGSWIDARIDRSKPDRTPVPKPDIRSMLRPIGPVAVFCASNFPLAFSVAGGDTASALAAGCPVIVIAHTAHPGTAELAGKAIAKAVSENGLDNGVFSLIFSSGFDAGQTLVKHRLVKAVGFTGSRKGGQALIDLSAERPEPIPVFAEMSSVNPVFVLPEALKKRSDEIAEGLFASFTLGHGQFCTKPGIVVLPDTEGATAFAEKLASLAESTETVTLLTEGMRDAYKQKLIERDVNPGETGVGFMVATKVKTVSTGEFLSDSSLSEEVFGPSTLLVLAKDRDDFTRIAKGLEGQLTATIHAEADELLSNSRLIAILEDKAGRLVHNSFPTGVEVCGAMVHGGPYPATSDARSTSVGKRAIRRFTRLIAYQGFPESALPDQLKDSNPLSINRIDE